MYQQAQKAIIKASPTTPIATTENSLAGIKIITVNFLVYNSGSKVNRFYFRENPVYINGQKLQTIYPEVVTVTSEKHVPKKRTRKKLTEKRIIDKITSEKIEMEMAYDPDTCNSDNSDTKKRTIKRKLSPRIASRTRTEEKTIINTNQ